MMIAIQKASGVSIMRVLGDADVAECIEQWKAVNPGQYVSHAEIAEADLPKDRATRASWRMGNGKVVAGAAPSPADKSRAARLAWGASMGLTPAQVNAMFPA